MKNNKVKEFNSLLASKKLTIVCAESITAGLLASTIASIPGASEILIGSLVTYNRNFKTNILNVDPRIIDKHTAESTETTNEMVIGLIKHYPGADIFVAVTGVASKPVTDYIINKKVGQIYISVYYQNKLHSLEHIIDSNDRNTIREKTVEYIFEKLIFLIKSV